MRCLLKLAAPIGRVATGPRYAPPRESLFGVRSLSLVLADFGSLFLLLLFIIISHFLCFVFAAINYSALG